MSGTAAIDHAEGLGVFVGQAPSSYHVVFESAQRLENAGFIQLDETKLWDGLHDSGRFFVVRDGSLIAWIIPAHRERLPNFRIVGAHTDSPSFKLKPRPSTGAYAWWQAGVEVYGGPLLNSWMDRELCLAGRVVVQSDRGYEHRLVATGPVARIPQLAIHLDRSANQSLSLDPQQHMQPIWGCGDQAGDVLEFLAAHVQGPAIPPDHILGWDVVLADTQPARRFGARGEFLASGRLDNLASVHAGVTALVDGIDSLEHSHNVSVFAAFDHEEVGSRTRSGAGGSFLEDVLMRVGDALGFSREQHRASWAGSAVLSADAGHLVHPNYQGRHDPVNRPVAGGGPLLKINAQQQYATDAVGAAQWKTACAQAGVSTQDFVSHNAVACGSTIGPMLAARLGINTVDVGVGLLSMHSAREMAHIADLHALKSAIGQWWLG